MCSVCSVVYGFMVLWFYGFMVLWFCGFVVLWFCGFVVLFLAKTRGQTRSFLNPV